MKVRYDQAVQNVPVSYIGAGTAFRSFAIDYIRVTAPAGSFQGVVIGMRLKDGAICTFRPDLNVMPLGEPEIIIPAEGPS